MPLKLALIFCLLACIYAKPKLNSQNLSNRIIGGKEAEQGEFPYLVSIQVDDWFGGYLHLCGGSIINNYWILTSGNYVRILEFDPVYKYLGVMAGNNAVSSSGKFEQRIEIEKKFAHENCTGSTSTYDIGLMKLKKPLVFNDYVKPIALPIPGSEVEEGSDFVVAGWGTTEPGISDDYLRKIDVKFIDFETCDKAIKDFLGYSILKKDNMCTGPLTGGVSVCNYDTGGPLIKRRGNGDAEVVGTVTYGVHPCGQVGAPSVYIKVSHYIDWINNIISNN